MDVTLCEQHLRALQKKARCPHAISNFSLTVKDTTEVGKEVRQCWRRCAGCCGKRGLTSMTFQKNLLVIVGFVSTKITNMITD